MHWHTIISCSVMRGFAGASLTRNSVENAEASSDFALTGFRCEDWATQFSAVVSWQPFLLECIGRLACEARISRHSGIFCGGLVPLIE